MGTLVWSKLKTTPVMTSIQVPSGEVSEVTSQLKETLVTSSNTNTKTSQAQSNKTKNSFTLEKDIGTSMYDELWPVCQTGNSEETDAKTREFLRRVVEILLDHITVQNDRTTKILDFHNPEQLKEVIDFAIPDEPLNLDQLLVDCKDTLKYQVKTGHPRFFNQLSCGLDIVSMAGEWLAATANTNMFTYEIAPVFIMMEHEVLKKMREIIGFEGGDSILAPGGSISNMYGLLSARHKYFPEFKVKGAAAYGGKIAIYTSEQSHYSIKGACATIGLGLENCFGVECDEKGRMKPEKLEEMILKHKSEGRKPFFCQLHCRNNGDGSFRSSSANCRCLPKA